MSLGLQKAYIFNDPDKFVYDETKVEIVGNVARLKLIENEATYSQDYSSATGFNYDSALAEFVAGVLRQKDQRAANALVGATYTSSKNLNWALTGTLAATDVGTPVLSGGKLVCLGGGNNGVRYDGVPEVGTSAGNIGAVRFRYTPNYSGSPAANYSLIEFSPTSGNNSRAVLFHASTGTLRLTAYTSVGTVKHSAAVFSAVPWSPVAGTEYEFEMNWDTLAGIVRLFVNGVLIGSMPVSSYDRGTSATRMHVGAGTVYLATDGSFNDVQVFSAVQHTAGYTPGYTVPENVYLASVAELPEFENVATGKFLEILSFSSSDTATPRYSFEVGQSGTFVYWNGSAWVASNGSYAQANDAATVAANIASLSVADEDFLLVKVHFQSSNTQQAVSFTALEILESTDYSTEPQLITPEERFAAGELTSFEHVASIPAGTEIRYILEIESAKKYWNGVLWSDSDGSFEKSNTMQEVEDNLLKAIDEESYVKLLVLLKTEDDSVTPELTSATFTYDADAGGERGFYDSILGFIGAESLTDEEFESIEVETPDYNQETYLALRAILEGRENVSDQVKRLESFFIAKGVSVSSSTIPAPASNIFLGSGL